MNSIKLRNTVLLITVFSLWLSIKIDALYEQYLGLFLILTFGILHGANDIKIMLKQPLFSSNEQTNWLKHLILYVFIVLAFALLFYQFLWLSLLIFMLSSAYHFGEQHWNYWFPSQIKHITVLYVSYGLMIFLLLFNTHLIEVIDIIAQITGFVLTENLFNILLQFNIVFFTVSYLYIIYHNNKLFNWNIVLKELFYLGILYMVFKMAVLIWAFSIYFIFWHTIPSLFDQIDFLYKKQSLQAYVQYFKQSVWYWLTAIISLILVFYLFYDEPKVLIAILFSFLAALTFPHVWVMKRMFGENVSK